MQGLKIITFFGNIYLSWLMQTYWHASFFLMIKNWYIHLIMPISVFLFFCTHVKIFIFLHTRKKIKIISKVFLKMINVYPNARQKKIWNKNILSMGFTCNQTGCKLNNTVLFYLKILYRYIIDIKHYQILISGIDWHLCGFRIKTLVFIVETGGFGVFFFMFKENRGVHLLYHYFTFHYRVISILMQRANLFFVVKFPIYKTRKQNLSFKLKGIK